MLVHHPIIEVLGETSASDAYKLLLLNLNSKPVYQPIANMVFHSFFELGISLAFDRKLGFFDYAFLHVLPENRFLGYKGDLPYGVNISDKRKDVRRRMGRPARVNKLPTETSYLYDREPILISFSFAPKKDEQLWRVCLMLKSTNSSFLRQ